MRVGYGPDVDACRNELGSFLSDDHLGAVREGIRRFNQKSKTTSRPAAGQAVPNEAEVRRRDLPRLWLDSVQRVSDLGPDVVNLPFIRLADIAFRPEFFSNNEYTEAKLDLASHVAVRWFIHSAGSGIVNARLMARAIALSGARARAELRQLDGYLWRTSPAPDSPNINEQGTHGALDVRLVGRDDGIWEIAVTGPDLKTSQTVLDEMVNAVGRSLPDMSGGGVRTVVREQLREELLLRKYPAAEFWKL